MNMIATIDIIITNTDISNLIIVLLFIQLL